MQKLPLLIAAMAFLLPIGYVLTTNVQFGEIDDTPPTGTLLYFYSPG